MAKLLRLSRGFHQFVCLSVTRILAGVILALMLTGGAIAGPIEDAWTAYKGGDFATALQIWRPRATQGVAFAQVNVGIMYYSGQGVPQNYVQAHMWVDLAASRFPPSAREDRDEAASNRDVVASKMMREQLAEAKKLLREWKPKGPTR